MGFEERYWSQILKNTRVHFLGVIFANSNDSQVSFSPLSLLSQSSISLSPFSWSLSYPLYRTLSLLIFVSLSESLTLFLSTYPVEQRDKKETSVHGEDKSSKKVPCFCNTTICGHARSRWVPTKFFQMLVFSFSFCIWYY